MVLDGYDDVLLPTTRAPLAVTAADGMEVTVTDGETERTVIDATAQVGTNPLGHRNDAVMERMRQYRDGDGPLMVAGNDFHHPLQRDLAERFTDIYPGDQQRGDIKAYYCNSGSEAVERGCLKAAQLARGGNTYVAFRNAFHGRTSLALSCNFSKAAHTEGYNSLFRALPVPFADRDHDVDDCLAALDRTIVQEGADNINAVIMEPIQGEGGYVVPQDGFLHGVREVTRDHGVPLVMDEVQASLRTGNWFACEEWDVEPDMIAVAKAFSGGVAPFGAALIQDRWAADEPGKHSGTFGGNPKECLAALATIDTIRDNDHLANARRQGGTLAGAWEDLERHGHVVEHRGVGLMRGIEFTDAATRDAVLDALLEEHGILSLGCGHDRFNPSIRFLLPVNVDDETTDRVADGVREAVSGAG